MQTLIRHLTSHHRKYIFGLLFGGLFAVATFFTVTIRQSQSSPQAPEVLGATSESPAIKEETSSLSLSPENILWYVNQERTQRDIAPMKLEIILNETARMKNEDMKKYNYFDHVNPKNKKTFDDIIKSSDYTFIKIGENLAMGNFKTSKEVVDAWMKSPDHRKNILDASYNDMGLAITPATIHGVSTLLITQHFGNPRENCPSVDEHKKKTINGLQAQLAATLHLIEEQKEIIGEYQSDEEVSEDTYNAAIAIHNTLVNQYNRIAESIEELANVYNAEVRNFEACIRGER